MDGSVGRHFNSGEQKALIKGTAAAPSGGSQALQAWSSPAHTAAAEPNLVFTLEGNAPVCAGST